MKIPQVLLIEVKHAPGSLARVLARVGEAGLQRVKGTDHLSRALGSVFELKSGLSPIVLNKYRWEKHCRGLFQLPIAA